MVDGFGKPYRPIVSRAAVLGLIARGAFATEDDAEKRGG